MFEAVLFDLDGVIIDTANYHYSAWKKLGDSLDISFDRHFNEGLKGISREESLRLILEHGGIADTVSQEMFDDLALTKNKTYVAMIKDVTEKDVFPGIKELLDELLENQIKIALASASKNGPLLLDRMGITSYFDAIVDPSSVAKGKPAPDIFLAAAEALDVPIEHCIGIEDSIAGITAITSSGALPIGVGRQEDLGDTIPVVSNTRFLTLDYLKKQWP